MELQVIINTGVTFDIEFPEFTLIAVHGGSIGKHPLDLAVELFIVFIIVLLFCDYMKLELIQLSAMLYWKIQLQVSVHLFISPHTGETGGGGL